MPAIKSLSDNIDSADISAARPKTTKIPVKVKAPRVKAPKVKAPRVKPPHVSSPAARLLGLVNSPHPLLDGGRHA